jgi:hypothetical protein
VYLTVDGAWSPVIADARVAPDARTADTLLATALADAGRVVGPYLVAVRVAPGEPPVPAELRERMRVRGPTVGPAAGARAGTG